MHKINYLLASWSGKRIHIPNPGDYLQRHIEKLNKVSHNLAQVSIGCPENPSMTSEYRKYIDSLKSLDDGTPIVVYYTPNIGLSYGQYSHMFDKCRDKFSHFIFMEDDYIPAADNFDTILADQFDELYASKNCGYLCQLVFSPDRSFGKACKILHASVSNGISSNKVLNKIWDKFGCIPHLKKNQRVEQIVFSQGFTDCDYEIHDTIETYRCIFHNAKYKVLWVFGDTEKDLLLPVQYFDEPKLELIQVVEERKHLKKKKRNIGIGIGVGH